MQEFQTGYMIMNSKNNLLFHTLRENKLACIDDFIFNKDTIKNNGLGHFWNYYENLGYQVKKVEVKMIGE